MIVAFGTQRDRYQSAYEMQCYSGIAPVTEASGNSQWVHFLRIIYRFWKDGKPYDEALYMQSLRRRGSLLAEVVGPSTSVGWKSVAGFQKLF